MHKNQQQINHKFMYMAQNDLEKHTNLTNAVKSIW